jgi:hypothetical protein
LKKIQSENAALYPGIKTSYKGRLTAFSLIVKSTTKKQVNRVIRKGLVLKACHHDCESTTGAAG